MNDNYAAINKKKVETLVEELTYLNSVIMNELNILVNVDIHTAIDELKVLQSKNVNTLNQKDLHNVKLLTDKLATFNSSVLNNLNSKEIKNFVSSIEALTDVQNKSLDIVNIFNSNYKDLKIFYDSLYNTNIKIQNQFTDLKMDIKYGLNGAKNELENTIDKLSNLEVQKITNRVKIEIKDTFLSSIKEIAKNNIVAEELSKKNILSIEKHNQSIKTINLKAIFSSFIIAFMLGVLTITTFQIDILKKIILSEKLENLKKMKIAIDELEKEKMTISSKYKISKKVQELLDNNVELVVVNNEKFVVVHKQNTKKVYISKQGHGVIFLK